MREGPFDAASSEDSDDGDEETEEDAAETDEASAEDAPVAAEVEGDTTEERGDGRRRGRRGRGRRDRGPRDRGRDREERVAFSPREGEPESSAGMAPPPAAEESIMVSDRDEPSYAGPGSPNGDAIDAIHSSGA